MTTTTPPPRKPIDEVRDALEKMGGQFQAVMPTKDHVNRFIRVVMTAVQGNPELLEADRNSFYAACMRCAQDGLLPDGKQAVLKIYNTKVGNDKWEKRVAYEPMTDGLMIKLRNSGEVVGAPKVHVVYDGDEFDYQLGDNEQIVHRPPKFGLPRGNIVGAYSIVKLKSGDISREVMSIADIDGIMQRTKSKKQDGTIYGPWVTDKAEMCRKTVFKRHTKRLPRSTDFDNVINYDNEVNGIDLGAAPGASQTAAQTVQQGARRPAALTAVANAGGTPMPEQAMPEKREPVTIDQQGGQQGPNDGPRDIL